MKTRYETVNFGFVNIVKYDNHKKVRVKFENTGFECVAQMSALRVGSVKDRTARNHFGAGYLGVGEYVANGSSAAYQKWRDMLSRCYNKDDVAYSYYGGRGVTVCDDWLNFQLFAKWFYSKYFEGAHLDKDIKKEGNLVYCPDFCTMVTQKDNNIKAQATSATLRSPEGEVFDVYNISEFCRNKDSKLCPKGMLRMISGKRNTYKGWSVIK